MSKYKEKLKEANQMLDKLNLEKKAVLIPPIDFERLKGLEVRIGKQEAKRNQLLNLIG